MDHCQNASESERAGERLLDRPATGEFDEELAGAVDSWTQSTDDGTIHDLDRWADELRQRHLQAALTSLAEREELDGTDRAAIAACSRAIVDGVLRGPHQQLSADDREVAPVVAELFDLED